MSEPRPARRDAEVGGGGTAIWHSAFPEQVLDGDITLEPPGQSCTNQLPQPGPAGNHQQRPVLVPHHSLTLYRSRSAFSMSKKMAA
jgi:hypothetical protein